MPSISGYSISELLFEGRRFRIYRGHDSEGAPVIIKVSASEFPSQEELELLNHEFEIGSRLKQADCIIPYLDFPETDHGRAIIMKDCGARSLDGFLKEENTGNNYNFAKKISIAIQLARGLAGIHSHGIIHLDIKPANIVITPEDVRLWYIDFGSASLQHTLKQNSHLARVRNEDLLYLSPEQTGRMNRMVDYRTDFYSLGIILYELFTGVTPFSGKKGPEIVHAHIALLPESPEKKVPDIPGPFARVLMKLLAKNAEERYQSAAGLLKDLEFCQNSLRHNGNIPQFNPGQDDISGRFIIPEKLYGRDTELEYLNEVYRQCVEGEQSCLLIKGPSGVGKSALVKELNKTVSLENGFMITGKFERYKNGIPYSAIADAIKELTLTLLHENEKVILEWNEKIRAACEPNLRLLVELAPELGRLTGSSKSSQESFPEDNANRLILVLQKFLQCFSSSRHPLVLFLDDIQWADSASLKLVQKIIAENEIKNLLIILAFREREVSPNSEIGKFVGYLKNVSPREIQLSPLNLKRINSLLCEILHTTPQKVTLLTEIIFEKTGGNPFFIKEFLNSLDEEGLIKFSNIKSKWEWDPEKIRAREIGENVVELTIERQEKLPEDVQQALRAAACIGLQFDGKLLGALLEKNDKETEEILLPAVQQGFIVKMTSSDYDIGMVEKTARSHRFREYRFLHDRICQAALASLSAEETAKIHHEIGKILPRHYADEDISDYVYELTGHRNRAHALINDSEEAGELAQLNYLAGQKAMKASAYSAALNYMRTGLDLLPEQESGGAWNSIALKLHKGIIDLSYLAGDFRAAEKLTLALQEKLDDDIERAELQINLITGLCQESRYEEAIEKGLQALSLTGIELPRENLKKHWLLEIQAIEEIIATRGIYSLLEAGKIEQKKTGVALKIMAALTSPAFITDQLLLALICAQAVHILLIEGVIPEAAGILTLHGGQVATRLNSYKEGFEYGELAIKLCDRFDNPAAKCRAMQPHLTFSYHWLHPLHSGETQAEEGFRLGVQSGEFQFAGYFCHHKATFLFYSGRRLELIKQKLKEPLEFTRKTRNQVSTFLIEGVEMLLLNLTGKTRTINDYEYNDIGEEDYLSYWETNQSAPVICLYKIMKAQILFIYQDYENALKNLNEAENFLHFIPGHFACAAHNFFTSLCLLAFYPGQSDSDRETSLKIVETNQQIQKYGKKTAKKISNICTLWLRPKSRESTTI